MGVGWYAMLEERKGGVFGRSICNLEASICDIYPLARSVHRLLQLQHVLPCRSWKNWEYLLFSPSSSKMTSNLLPVADKAETRLRRPINRPINGIRIVERCMENVMVTLHFNALHPKDTLRQALPRDEA